MKPQSIIGVLLIVFGAFVVFRGLTYRSQTDSVRIGDVKITAEERRTIPTWVGVAALVGGLVVLTAGTRGRRG
jgi:uncharacterized membrane protein